jgi:hypothetical protein
MKSIYLQKENSSMNKQSKEYLVNSSEHGKVLDEEELAGVAGAGLAGMVKGFKSASAFGGDTTAKVKSAWYGLKKGNNEKTQSYALQQATKSVRKSSTFSALERTTAQPSTTGKVRPQ